MGTLGARTGDERAGSGAEHGAGRVAGAALLLRGSRFGAGAGWRTRARVGYRPIPQSALPGVGRGPDALLLSGVGSAGSAGPGAGCGLGLRLGGVPDAVLGDLTEVEACFADVQRAGPPLPVAWHPAQSRAHRALTPGGWCLCETCARVLQLHPEDRGEGARAQAAPPRGGAGASGQGDVCATCPLPHTAERPHPVTFLDGSSWVSQHKGEGGGLCPGRRGCRGSPAWAPGAFPPRGTQLFCTQSPWRSVAWAQLAGRGQVEGEGKSAAKPGQRRRGLEGGQGTRDGEAQRPRARGGRRAPPGGHREERTRGAFAASAGEHVLPLRPATGRLESRRLRGCGRAGWGSGLALRAGLFFFSSP